MTTPTDPPPLPSSLQAEAPTTKLLFVWLEPQGEVGYTVRELAELLSVSPGSVQTSLTRLRVLNLLKDTKAASGSAPGRYRIVVGLQISNRPGQT